MSLAGELDRIVVASRLVLLDALEAHGGQRHALILVGAQAVYLRVGRSSLAVAEYTRDADLAIDIGRVVPEPLIGDAQEGAGFAKGEQPGTWISTRRSSEDEPIPVDFLVAEAMAGRPGRRAANVPGQPENSARQVRGLEGVLIDNDIETVAAFDDDPRSFDIRVAGPAALIVAKVHKISERLETRRSHDKDALDIYRVLRVFEPSDLGMRFDRLLKSTVSDEPSRSALTEFGALFGSVRAPGTDMIVRATSGLEPEDEVRRSSVALAQDLLGVLAKST